MVLDEASADTRSQESIGEGQAPGYYLHHSKLPRPYTLVPFVDLEKLQRERVVRDTSQYLGYVAALLQRHPTQEEAEAVAYHLAFRDATILTSVQLGNYWGLYRAWSTRKNFNWPLIDPYKKFPDFNPRNFLGFEGQRAVFVRHLTRIGVWGVWGGIIGHFLSDIYASTRAMREMYADDRLQAIVQKRDEELKKRAHAQAAGSPRSSPPVTSVTPAVNVGGAEGESYSNSSTTEADFYGGENQAPARQADQWSMSRPAPAASDDDASPTGGLGLWDDSGDSASGGSAWDRLRQESVPKASTESISNKKSSENDWISQEASSQQPKQQGGAWDRIRQQQQQQPHQEQQQKQQQKHNDDSWWK